MTRTTTSMSPFAIPSIPPGAGLRNTCGVAFGRLDAGTEADYAEEEGYERPQKIWAASGKSGFAD